MDIWSLEQRTDTLSRNVDNEQTFVAQQQDLIRTHRYLHKLRHRIYKHIICWDVCE
jgi:hypothetical protein